MYSDSKITPEGTRDLLLMESTARRIIESKLSSLYKMRGYSRIETPTLEFFDVFNRKSCGIPAENMYKLCDSKGRIMVLRCDNTLPIARVAATRLKEMSIPIRLYYSQNVFSVNPSLSGMSNERPQSGIELIGYSGIRADLEIILTAFAAFECCSIDNYKIEIGTADFFSTLCSSLNIDDEKKSEISMLTEAKNYQALSDLLNQLPASPEINVLKRLPRLTGGTEVIDFVQSAGLTSEELKPLLYLEELYERLIKLGYKDRVSIDLGLVHRSNYYTGMVFRGYIAGSGVTVISGGRYDNLIDEFGRSLPGAGFGVTVDELADVILSENRVPAPKTPEVIIFAADKEEEKAVELLKEYAGRGIICENSIFSGIEETLAYAKRRHISKLVYIEGDKVNEREVGDIK